MKSYIKLRKDEETNQDNTVFQRRKKRRKNADKVVYNVRGSKLANKEPSKNEDCHNNKSKEYNTYIILFDKEKSSKKHSTTSKNNDNIETAEATTQIKSDINENKNKVLLTCDHDINNYHHYKNNNKKHKEKYIESSITNNENNTDVKTKKVNNSLTYQTNINQINVDNDKLEQNFVEKKKLSQ